MSPPARPATAATTRPLPSPLAVPRNLYMAGANYAGSWVVRKVSNTDVPDTTSGFRAYTREAALRMIERTRPAQAPEFFRQNEALHFVAMRPPTVPQSADIRAGVRSINAEIR